MTTPVTREELKAELARYPTREELRAELKAELARYPTREELREELAKQKAELIVELGQEIARQMSAGYEMMRQLFGVLDDKQRAQNDQHASLARRVDRLEVAVFDPPKP